MHRMHPKQFLPNDAWLALRANTAPLVTPEGEFDVFVLMDAASMYIFGQALVAAGTEAPSERDAANLLREGWLAKQEWPMQLILVGQPTSQNGFSRAAQSEGIPVVAAAPAEVAAYVSHLRRSFARYLDGLTHGDD